MRPQQTTRPSVLGRVRRTVTLWEARRVGRAELARLSAGQLRDLGLTPGDALAEAAKPFWRG